MQLTMELDFVIPLILTGFEKQVNHEPWNASNMTLKTLSQFTLCKLQMEKHHLPWTIECKGDDKSEKQS